MAIILASNIEEAADDGINGRVSSEVERFPFLKGN